MSQKFEKLIVRLLQLLIVLIPVGLFLWLLNIAVVPSGSFETSLVVNERSPFIDRLLPDARVETPYQTSTGDWLQKVVGDPVFFFVHPQRSFAAIEAEIRFKNTGVPIVELGILADPTTGAYTLQSLQNLLIDNSDWSRLESGGLVLLQRNKKFASLEDFLKTPPARGEVTTYHYNLSEPYRLSGYNPTSVEQNINISLRGSHEFYTYIKNETLRFAFSFMDMNRQVGEDAVTLVVINEAGKPVAEIRAQDDGNTTSEAKPSELRFLTLQADGLPEGVYKIQMKASEDIFFRSIKTSQQKITFLNQIWLADEVGYNDFPAAINFWTEGKNLKLATRHATGTQTLAVGKGTVAITEPFIEYNYAPPEAGVVSVVVPKAEDLIVRANGHFAFSAAQYFNPDPVRLTAETDLDRSGVNYIIAKYTSPRSEGEWLVAKTSFGTTAVSFEEKTWKLAISVPTIDQPDREFLLNKITLTFLRPPLTWQEIKNRTLSFGT